MPEPLILATWTYGRQACAAGWPHIVRDDGGALDAVEHACRAVEADPENMTVGYGGRPDASGEVTLDAAVMLSPSRCGAVCCVRNFRYPTSLARLVMERTPHVMLAGDGAERFARQQGMEPTDLLTEAARAAWQEWRHAHPDAGEPAAPKANIEEADHDTVGVLALDARGTLAGACSTSGLAFKLPGRVGDSPIIGHGLYVDPARGAAVATGHGELVMGVCGTFLAVERMGQGASPAEAAADVVRRIHETYGLKDDHQVGVIALAPSGEWSSAALRPGFRVAVRTPDRNDLLDPEHVLLP
ncbi:MAG TPA: N(4)-(beta-N-acetylglucosaminyl)-L-asparaginase [Phycisphaerae bacterium]|nr:N(4)-(beta-N-acetylglucosaminyl)-L-asparaginase [Phycisphaerae bacterium]